MAHPRLSIVIPAYNESARIDDALERVMSCVSEQGWDAEVLVVDDGSKDDTAAIVQRWMKTYSRLHLVQNPGNRGKGYSVRNGLLQAAGDIVMFTDADLSAPMEEAEDKWTICVRHPYSSHNRIISAMASSSHLAGLDKR